MGTPKPPRPPFADVRAALREGITPRELLEILRTEKARRTRRSDAGTARLLLEQLTRSAPPEAVAALTRRRARLPEPARAAVIKASCALAPGVDITAEARAAVITLGKRLADAVGAPIPPAVLVDVALLEPARRAAQAVEDEASVASRRDAIRAEVWKSLPKIPAS